MNGSGGMWSMWTLYRRRTAAGLGLRAITVMAAKASSVFDSLPWDAALSKRALVPTPVWKTITCNLPAQISATN